MYHWYTKVPLEALMKFKTVDVADAQAAALLETVVATKGTTKHVIVTCSDNEDPSILPLIVKGLRVRLAKQNLRLFSQKGEGHYEVWVTGETPTKREVKVEAP